MVSLMLFDHCSCIHYFQLVSKFSMVHMTVFFKPCSLIFLHFFFSLSLFSLTFLSSTCEIILSCSLSQCNCFLLPSDNISAAGVLIISLVVNEVFKSTQLKRMTFSKKFLFPHLETDFFFWNTNEPSTIEIGI